MHRGTFFATAFSFAAATAACSSGNNATGGGAGATQSTGSNGSSLAGSGGASDGGAGGNTGGRLANGGTGAHADAGANGGADASGGGGAADGSSGTTTVSDAGVPPACSSAARGQFVPMSQTGAASARSAPSMMWAGNAMLVYDRCGKASDALYSPCDDRWRALTWSRSSCATVTVEASPKVYLLGGTPATFTELDGAAASSSNLSVTGMPTTTLPTAVATSSGVIVWGGTTLLANSSGNVASNAGAVYDRAADRWRPTSISGAPSPRIAPGAWSSAGFAVWGGQSATSIPTDGGRFDCLNQSLPPCSLFQDGAIYDPVANGWTAMGTAGDLPSPRRDHLIAWAGDKLLVWGGYGGMPFAFTRGGAFYDTKTKAWTKVAPLPDTATVGPPFWTGSRLLMVEGGNLPSWAYTPGASGWTSIPPIDGVQNCSVPKLSHGALASICTSSSSASMVAVLLEDGATAWNRYAVPDMQLEQPGVLWNGTELLVWGGNPPPSRASCPPMTACDPAQPPSVNSGQFLIP